MITFSSFHFILRHLTISLPTQERVIRGLREGLPMV